MGQLIFLSIRANISVTSYLLSLCLHFTASDVAGEVAKVGPAVKKFKPGDKVVATLNILVMLILHVLPSF